MKTKEEKKKAKDEKEESIVDCLSIAAIISFNNPQ